MLFAPRARFLRGRGWRLEGTSAEDEEWEEEEDGSQRSQDEEEGSGDGDCDEGERGWRRGQRKSGGMSDSRGRPWTEEEPATVTRRARSPEEGSGKGFGGGECLEARRMGGLDWREAGRGGTKGGLGCCMAWSGAEERCQGRGQAGHLAERARAGGRRKSNCPSTISKHPLIR